MKITMNFERYLTQQDAAVLSRLTEMLMREMDIHMNAGEELLELLSTAILLPDNVQKDDCAALYSEVSYIRLDTKERQTVTLVCPNDVDHALARISILAPLALALIGRRINSIVEVNLPFGGKYDIRIADVKNLANPSYKRN